MSRKDLWQVSAALLLATVVLSVVHIALFRAPRDFFLYMLEDLAFLPLEVLLVTLVIDRLLGARERQERQRKLNMVVGSFFTASGYELLRALAPQAAERNEIATHLGVDLSWTEAQMRASIAWCQDRLFRMQADPAALERLKELFATHRAFLLNLLENPMLLEHEVFTDMLWAVSHLAEELGARARVTALPPADVKHLATDMERAYTQLQVQWLHYMIHLRQDYPYLFSFAARTNPLRQGAKVEIAE